MISTGELKRGLAIEIADQIYSIEDWQHLKIGRGGAIVRIKLRNLRTGSTTQQTFTAGEKFPQIDLDQAEIQYQYSDGENYHFMNTETYDQIVLTAKQLGNSRHYLKDDSIFHLLSYNSEPLEVEPPIMVDLRVVATDPGFKGDTATGGTKPATLESGLVVQVPLFVTTDEIIRVKSSDGTYIERVG